MCEIALAPSGKLALTIPSASGSSHTVEIPLTLDGLNLIKKTLLARQSEPVTTIGSAASPIAYEINKFLQNKAKERAQKVQEKAALADDLLDLLNIELEL